jgi:hypothetical protein
MKRISILRSSTLAAAAIVAGLATGCASDHGGMSGTGSSPSGSMGSTRSSSTGPSGTASSGAAGTMGNNGTNNRSSTTPNHPSIEGSGANAGTAPGGASTSSAVPTGPAR